MASKNQFVTFNNGEKYPILGFGTWKVIEKSLQNDYFKHLSIAIAFLIFKYDIDVHCTGTSPY